MSAPLLETVGVSKRYGSVVALREADLVVQPGEIHALLGANGAGKSTLVKILTGVVAPNAGTIAINGTGVRFSSPVDALRLGLAPVFQDPALVPDLTVLDNLRLTGAHVSLVRSWLAKMDLGGIDLTELVRDLPLPQLRMIDLARAVSRDPYLLLLDEITAALPVDLADRVIAVMQEWKRRGRSVLFISHRLAEVRAICDVATVLRDGRNVDSFATSDGGEARMVSAMLGETAAIVRNEQRGPHTGAGARPPTEPVLEVRDLRIGTLDGVSFALHPGEVLGVAALEGQGQDLLFDVLAGDRRPASGDVLVRGKRITARHPADAIRQGIVLVPADRLHALLPHRSVRENLATPFFRHVGSWGPIHQRDERIAVDGAIARLSIDTRAQGQLRRLSGGNQQKVTIGRWLTSGFDVLLCFDPTRGIDVGTKHQIYDLVRELAAAGKAVLLFTSELREIALACDRAIVLYDGRITASLPAAEADEETLLHAAHGLRAMSGVPSAASASDGPIQTVLA